MSSSWLLRAASLEELTPTRATKSKKWTAMSRRVDMEPHKRIALSSLNVENRHYHSLRIDRSRSMRYSRFIVSLCVLWHSLQDEPSYARVSSFHEELIEPAVRSGPGRALEKIFTR